MGYHEYHIGRPGFHGVVRILILVNVVVHILQLLPGIGDVVNNVAAANPLLIAKGQVWRLFTYGFLHSPGDLMHILFNMFGLWMFGSAVEERMGSKKFLWFYLISIVASGLFSMFYLVAGQSPWIVGASGAIFAVTTMFAFYYPDVEILLMMVIPLKAKYAAILFAVMSIFGSMGNGGDIAHIVHLGGIAFAAAYHFWADMLINYFRNVIRKRDIAKEDKQKSKETVLHYYEPRKSRQEVEKEKNDVDDVLRKIKATGMKSLTEEEYRILEKASGKPVEREK